MNPPNQQDGPPNKISKGPFSYFDRPYAEMRHLSEPEIYYGAGIYLKHEGDNVTVHLTLRMMKYIEAVLNFTMAGYSLSRKNPCNYSLVYQVYVQTLEVVCYIGVMLEHQLARRQQVSLNSILEILNLHCSASLYYTLSKLRRDYNGPIFSPNQSYDPAVPPRFLIENIAVLTVPGASAVIFAAVENEIDTAPIRDPPPVFIPTPLYGTQSEHIADLNYLVYAQEAHSSAMCKKRHNNKEFFEQLEFRYYPLMINSTLPELVRYVLKVLRKLRRLNIGGPVPRNVSGECSPANKENDGKMVYKL